MTNEQNRPEIRTIGSADPSQQISNYSVNHTVFRFSRTSSQGRSPRSGVRFVHCSSEHCHKWDNSVVYGSERVNDRRF